MLQILQRYHAGSRVDGPPQDQDMMRIWDEEFQFNFLKIVYKWDICSLDHHHASFFVFSMSQCMNQANNSCRGTKKHIWAEEQICRIGEVVSTFIKDKALIWALPYPVDSFLLWLSMRGPGPKWTQLNLKIYQDGPKLLKIVHPYELDWIIWSWS